jgi:hypothetical protein
VSKHGEPQDAICPWCLRRFNSRHGGGALAEISPRQAHRGQTVSGMLAWFRALFARPEPVSWGALWERKREAQPPTPTLIVFYQLTDEEDEQ